MMLAFRKLLWVGASFLFDDLFKKLAKTENCISMSKYHNVINKIRRVEFKS